MRRNFKRSRTLLAAALLSLGFRGMAQEPQSAPSSCESVSEPWNGSHVLASARNARDAAYARLLSGEPVRLALHPDGEIAYLTLPQGEGEAASFGGLASFTVEQPGTYRVGLGEPVWVDVAQDGKPAEPVGFGPGPACSGIRKTVSFDLEAGSHVLEISGGRLAKTGVIVERLP